MFDTVNKEVNTIEELCEKIKEIIEIFPFKKLDIANHTFSISLKEQKITSGPFSIYTDQPESNDWPSSVEIRANFKKHPEKQMLIIDLRKPVRATIGDFDKAFSVSGKNMGLADPKNPSETYAVFGLPGIEMRIGFDKSKVTSFVLDSFKN